MPQNIFEAISPAVSSFLGDARIDFRAGGGESEIAEGVLLLPAQLENKPYLFTATRAGLPFTKLEIHFCRELLIAFTGLYSGFKMDGYAAHFRTALLASIMDITVARFLRGDRGKGFWPIQQLLQLLKHLSYQRYEGKPATTGFLVHRTTEPLLRKTLKERRHSLIPLQPPQPISSDFLDNPLTYRFVDGQNLFFIANIQMLVSGLLRTDSSTCYTDIERTTQKEMFSLVKRLGSGAFAITVNDVSEIEVLLSQSKLLVRRKGRWAVFDPEMISGFLGDCINSDAIVDLLWTVYALSKQRHGTVILIYTGTARQLSSLKKGSVGGNDPIGQLLASQVKGHTVSQLKANGMLFRILSSDGMTVLDKNGKLLAAGFIIDTSHAREMVTGGGRTTASIAASFFGKVIKVSQDGPIELYREGRMVYRFG